MRAYILVAATLFVAACSNNLGSQKTVAQGTECTDPRPQICTMEYNPVCAVLATGGRKQYASACNACADDAVKSYLPGECPIQE